MRIFTLILLAMGVVHRVPDLATARFGTFVSQVDPLSNEWSVTQLTFFPGELFTVRNLDSNCEDTFGHGAYKQKNDTLILGSIRSWTTFHCKFEVRELLIIPEKKYLTRPLSSESFQIQPIPEGYGPASDWITLRKYGVEK